MWSRSTCSVIVLGPAVGDLDGALSWLGQEPDHARDADNVLIPVRLGIEMMFPMPSYFTVQPRLFVPASPYAIWQMCSRSWVPGVIWKALLPSLVPRSFYTGPGHYDAFLNMTPEQWEVEIAVDVTAPAIATWMLLPKMIERRSGIIICITSGAAHTDPTGMPGRGATGPAYPTAKAAVNRFVQAIGKEFKDQSIAVIAVDPGFTLTERAERAVSQWGFDLSQAHPMAVPAKTVHHVCTCDNPMQYTGKVLVAANFVKEHRLL